MELPKLLPALVCWLALTAQGWGANEIQYMQASLTGQTLYGKVRAGAGHADVGEYWDVGGAAWTALTTTATTFDIALTEVSTTGFFQGSLPATATGSIVIEIWQDANDDATPDHSTDILLAEVYAFWNGTILGTNSLVSDGTGTGQISTTSGAIDTVVNTVTALALGTNAIEAGDIQANAFVRGHFADDTGLRSIRSNTAQAGAAGSITLDASASAVNDFYNGATVQLTAGTGSGQFRVITDYDGTTKIATVMPNWSTNPASGTTFVISPSGMSESMGGDVNVTQWAGSAVPTPAIAGHPDINVDAIEGNDTISLLTAAEANPNVLIDTTIDTVTSQTVFTLTAGSSVNDAYTTQAIVLYDSSNSDFPWVGMVEDYVGSTRTVTLHEAPGFTIVSGDGAKVFLGSNSAMVNVEIDTISPNVVADNRTWKFSNQNQVTSPNIIVETYGATGGFEGTLAMDFSRALNPGQTIATFNSSSVTAVDAADDEPIIDSGAAAPDRRFAHLTIDCTGADAGDYLFEVKVTTTDSQVITRRGRLRLQ